MKKIFILLICFCLFGCQSTQKNEPSSNEDPLVATDNNEDHSTQDLQPEQETVQENQSETKSPVQNEKNHQVQDEHSTSSNQSLQEQEEVTQEIPAPKQEVEKTEKKEVKVLIECQTILNNMDRLQNGYQSFIPQNGIILNTTSVEIKEGDTVLNVLKRVANQNKIKLSIRAGYVEGIANIDESICGDESGWIYSVNGKFINTGASNYKVNQGDEIKWQYTCENGRDLGLS